MLRLRFAAFTACALLLCVSLAAAAALPKIKRDTPYPQARTQLQKLGFAPAKLPDAQVCEKEDARCFPETFACAGTGRAGCVHVWRQGAMLIDVLTEGEEPGGRRACGAAPAAVEFLRLDHNAGHPGRNVLRAARAGTHGVHYFHRGYGFPDSRKMRLPG